MTYRYISVSHPRQTSEPKRLVQWVPLSPRHHIRCSHIDNIFMSCKAESDDGLAVLFFLQIESQKGKAQQPSCNE